MSRRSDVIVLSVGIVVVVGALIAVGAATVKTPLLTSGGALAEYAHAIEGGDLALADQLGPFTDGRTKAVGGAALSNAADRITAVTTKIDSSSGSSATGTVGFVLAGQRHSVKVTLATGPAQLGFLPSWRVTTPLTTTISVAVPVGGTAIVNGVEAPLGDDLKLTVYPGHYAVGLAAGNTFYTADAVPVDAATSPASAALTASPTPALSAEVLTQVKTAIDACVAQPVSAPAGCPFSEPAIGKLTGFGWTLDDYPTIAFYDPTHFFLQGGQVTANFVLTYSYIVNKQESDPIAIKGSGAVTFSGDTATATITAH